MGRKRKVMHFSSKEAYRKWCAYGHIHGIFEETPGHVKVYIRGKPVEHSSSRKKKGKKKRRRR